VSDFPFPYGSAHLPSIAQVKLKRRVRKFEHSPFAAQSSNKFFEAKNQQDGYLHLRWPGLFEFRIDSAGKRVDALQTGKSSLDSFHFYLLGPVLSFALLRQGIEQLHATVVVHHGRAFALLGDCGRGKSTLAAALIQRGCKLLVDDMLVLRQTEDGVWAFPGPPRLKLLPDSIEHVGLKRNRPANMNPLVQKKVLPMRARSFGQPVRLERFYALEAPVAATTAISLVSCSPQQGCMELVAAAYNLDEGRGRMASQLQWAAKIAKQVPVTRLQYPRKYSNLDAVTDRLLKDFGS
jgi:hypothetical protein